MIIRERKWLAIGLVVIVFAIAGVVYEITRKPRVPVPAIGDISSIQVVFYSTSPNPKPILADSARHKSIIAQVQNWLKSATPVGYEKDIPRMTFGPTTVIIKLNNKQELDVSQAWLLASVTQPDGRVIPAHQRSGEHVDFRSSDSNKVIRYYSPQLANWLTNDWQRDWNR